MVLIGMRGAGKSTVGAMLANRLGVELVDTDLAIEKREGRSVKQIFADGGEQAFRALEREALVACTKTEPAVIAAGGGAVLEPRNRAVLRALGSVVWLTVSPEEALERLRGSYARPALTALSPLEEARQLAAARAPLYEQVAAHAVATDGRTAKEVCDELEQLWHAISRHDVR